MSAPERIGAFFDFDGTLMESPSLERRFFAYLYRRGEIQRENFERWAAQAARAFLRKPRAAFLGNKFYLAGIHDSFVEEWAGIIAKDSLPLLPDGAAQIRWHLERGHRVVLVTGTLAPLLRAIASHLPAGVVIHATEVEIVHQLFTGRVHGEQLGFDAKARAAKREAAECGLDLAESFAYGNEVSDLAMLETVGHPVAVNASWRLKREAHRRGWSVCTWSPASRVEKSPESGFSGQGGTVTRGGARVSRNTPPANALEWTADLRKVEARVSSRPFDDIRRTFGAFEWVTFAYLAWLNAMLAVFHRGVANAAQYFVIHCWIGLGIVCLAWAAAHSRNRVLRFVRDWYPLPLYLFFFEELQVLVHAIFPGWFDRWLIQFDFNFAGVHPSVWLAKFSNPALNDFMQFAYMTYFLDLVVLPGILYAQKERLAYWNVMVSTAFANYTVYLIAVLFPIESPYHSLAAVNTTELSGGYFTAAIGLIEKFGRVHGGAFPSAHVAGSTVAILASWRYRRWLFWVCLPFFIAMCVSTVYGRYHYIADALAGLVVGAIGFAGGRWLMERNGALAEVADEIPTEVKS